MIQFLNTVKFKVDHKSVQQWEIELKNHKKFLIHFLMTVFISLHKILVKKYFPTLNFFTHVTFKFTIKVNKIFICQVLSEEAFVCELQHKNVGIVNIPHCKTEK